MPEITQNRDRVLQTYRRTLTDTNDQNRVYSSDVYPTVTSIEGVTSYRSGKLYTDDPYDYLSGKDLKRAVLQEANRAVGSEYDTGHEFHVTKNIASAGIIQYLPYPAGNGYQVYEGPIRIRYPFTSPWIDVSEIEPNYNMLGSGFIRQTIPTRHLAGLTAFIGELREGLPRLVGAAFAKQASLKSLGGEHLNVQFGIKPLIGDIQKFARAVKKGNALLRQLERDAGRVVRRRRRGPVEVESHDRGTFDMNAFIPPFADTGYDVTNQFLLSPRQVKVKMLDRIEHQTWFSAGYSYAFPHLNGDNSYFRKMEGYERRADILLGTRLTPDVVWQLTPWSWLIDWFGNLGTVLSNAEAFANDSLVLRYGYVMHEIHATRILTSEPVPVNTWNGRSAPILETYESVSKRRIRASPYGFGLDVESLSPSQWAILGALGMTKSPRILRP